VPTVRFARVTMGATAQTIHARALSETELGQCRSDPAGHFDSLCFGDRPMLAVVVTFTGHAVLPGRFLYTGIVSLDESHDCQTIIPDQHPLVDRASPPMHAADFSYRSRSNIIAAVIQYSNDRIPCARD
jgi:hypothetical protein